ncbi:MAG: cobalt-precorrin-5B (C(1))-methyltransferase CbiD [Breznakibacter sp.]
MILIFGGTTEGRMAADLLDLIGEPYLYCTKEPVTQKIKGRMLHGALDEAGITNLCQSEGIRLIINAAHPFATHLHQNIQKATNGLTIPVVRMERTYQPLEDNTNIRVFDSFDAMDLALGAISPSTILALTGVQTIGHFKRAKEKHALFFRILNTELSWEKACQSEIDKSAILPAPPQITLESLMQMVDRVKPSLLLTKESGESGFFNIKREVANERNIPLWVVRRPEPYETPYRANSGKELLKNILRLRKEQLKKPNHLRSGYTTGSCVTAAAAGAFRALMQGYFETTQSITLPDGQTITLPLFDGQISAPAAECLVIKDAGDDPDVTHAAEIGCHIRLIDQPGIKIHRGIGIGIVTLPGLQVAVGEPAINPVPRQMLQQTLTNLASLYGYEGGVMVTPFIPKGEELAQKTFNPRIGVVGGLSILGTSGHVRPYSAEAFLDAIRQQINVALHHNQQAIVLTAGKRSEQVLQPIYPHLDSTSFVHYGNSVGETIGMCVEAQFRQIVVGMMPGKAIKLAEGHLNTHSKHHTFNAQFAADLAKECGYPDEICAKINDLSLANAIADHIPFSKEEPYYLKLIARCHWVISENIPPEVDLHLYLINPADQRWIKHQPLAQ